MAEEFNIEQERFESSLMAQAYAFSGTDELPRLRERTAATGTCSWCQGTFPRDALFTRSREGALCNPCEDRRLAGVMG